MTCQISFQNHVNPHKSLWNPNLWECMMKENFGFVSFPVTAVKVLPWFLPGSYKLDDSCLLATLLCDTCHCTGLEENTVFGFIWLPMMPKSFCKKMQTLACDFVCQNETHDFSWFLIILLSLRQTLHSWKTNCDTRFCCYLSWSEG